jgi:DNA polymerase I-like protein with 3'-5' exonuclease and polymerase domains
MKHTVKIIGLSLMAVLCLTISSCLNTKNSKHLNTIDSLYTVLDSVKIKLQSLDSSKVKSTFSDYKENIEKIKLFFDDKKDDSTWSTITTYGVIRKPLKEYTKTADSFWEEIAFSRKQLDSLKSDIKAKDIPEDKIKEYTKSEVEAVNSLNQQVTIVITRTKESMHLYDSLNPKIIKIIQKLEKTGTKNPSKAKEEEEED